MNPWIALLIVAVPIAGLLAWLGSASSVIQIPPGRVGLLLVRGRPTDEVLAPGVHWVARLRRRLVAEYPSLELSLRAVTDPSAVPESSDLEQTADALRVTLGDRAQVVVGYTLRFRLDADQLKSVHERFGQEGFWTAARDLSSRAVRRRLSESDVTVDQLFGSDSTALEEQVATAVAEALLDNGLRMTMFSLGDVDLGRTGQVIQSAVRARFELEREEAEAGVRLARARIDADLEPYLALLTDAALRYREVDVWREMVHSQSDRPIPIPRRATIAWANSEQADSATNELPQGEQLDET